MRLALLLSRQVLRAMLVAHGSGAALLALVIAVESADASPGDIVALWRQHLPGLWASCAAVLTLTGAALAATRMRRGGLVLALGTLGVSPYRAILLVGVVGGLIGTGSALATASPVRGEVVWERADGGWIRNGAPIPDTVGGEVRAIPPPPRSSADSVATGLGAGVLGMALGYWSGAIPVLLGASLLLFLDTATHGLAERGAIHGSMRFVPACLLLGCALVAHRLRPLFPRRD